MYINLFWSTLPKAKVSTSYAWCIDAHCILLTLWRLPFLSIFYTHWRQDVDMPEYAAFSWNQNKKKIIKANFPVAFYLQKMLTSRTCTSRNGVFQDLFGVVRSEILRLGKTVCLVLKKWKYFCWTHYIGFQKMSKLKRVRLRFVVGRSFFFYS